MRYSMTVASLLVGLGAVVAVGANLPEDAVYPMLLSDADGKPLTGDGKYVLHSDRHQLPPVDAFWSVTMYDAGGPGGQSDESLLDRRPR